jgi:hypothetical protein
MIDLADLQEAAVDTYRQRLFEETFVDDEFIAKTSSYYGNAEELSLHRDFLTLCDFLDPLKLPMDAVYWYVSMVRYVKNSDTNIDSVLRSTNTPITHNVWCVLKTHSHIR